jgi:hypothetical protein
MQWLYLDQDKIAGETTSWEDTVHRNVLKILEIQGWWQYGEDREKYSGLLIETKAKKRLQHNIWIDFVLNFGDADMSMYLLAILLTTDSHNPKQNEIFIHH